MLNAASFDLANTQPNNNPPLTATHKGKHTSNTGLQRPADNHYFFLELSLQLNLSNMYFTLSSQKPDTTK